MGQRYRSLLVRSDLPSRTARDRLERALTRRFGPRIRALAEGVGPTHPGESLFGNAHMALLLYCGGWSESCRSSQFPDGLVYVGSEASFGVGCFVTGAPGSPSGAVHLVCPSGEAALEEASELASFVAREFPGVRSYARHLGRDRYLEFIDSGQWLSIEHSPWHPTAMQEDETYNHRCVALAKLFDLTSRSNPVRVLSTPGTRGFRRKAHLAFNRFSNFLRRTGSNYVLLPHVSELIPEVRALIEAHFDDIAAARPLLCSTAADYQGLVRFVPPLGEERFFSRVGMLAGPGWRRLVSFFAAERLDAQRVACFASITRRSAALLPGSVPELGFSAISQFSLLQFLLELANQGCEEVDLGGSETADLDRFKRQLGAHEEPSYWALFSG